MLTIIEEFLYVASILYFLGCVIFFSRGLYFLIRLRHLKNVSAKRRSAYRYDSFVVHLIKELLESPLFRIKYTNPGFRIRELVKTKNREKMRKTDLVEHEEKIKKSFSISKRNFLALLIVLILLKLLG